MPPCATGALFGPTTTDCRLASITFTALLPCSLPNFAVTVVGPAACVVSMPDTATIDATEVSLEFQSIPWIPVTSSELPSLNVATARICCFVPLARVDFGEAAPENNTMFTGCTATDFTELSSTAILLLELMPEEGTVAVMVSAPRPIPVTIPMAETRATWEGLAAVVQETSRLRSCFDPSSNVPVATRGCDVASGTVGLVGVTASEARFALLTVSAAGELFRSPSIAVMLVAPWVSPFARPCVPGDALTLATAGFDEFHVTWLVTSALVPSL